MGSSHLGKLQNVTSRRIKPELLEQLLAVEPSTDGMLEYRPCQVTLRSGRVLPRVCVIDAERYMTSWGVWPEDDEHKSSVDIAEVDQIEESPVRLPAKLANAIYEAGESGMGYTIYTLLTKDRRTFPRLTGGAVDFPQLPEGLDMADVADVLPHEGRDAFRERMPTPDESDAPYFWCLYETAA